MSELRLVYCTLYYVFLYTIANYSILCCNYTPLYPEYSRNGRISASYNYRFQIWRYGKVSSLIRVYTRPVHVAV